MDIKFNAAVAERLIDQMSGYCSGIMEETRALMKLAESQGEWRDNQADAFRNNVAELAKDLNQALSLESEYMRTFHQRVTELRG